ncbi:MAG: ABC transporter ATP-binding protein, partial [Bacteroidota bacterium]
MFLLNLILRLIKSAIPLTMLYIGKEIIDEVLALIDGPESASRQYLWTLIAVELGLAVLSEIINRTITLADGLLGDLFS